MATITTDANNQYFQPIIRGIQNVGSVQILYRYNFTPDGDNFYLPIPKTLQVTGSSVHKSISLGTSGVPVAGFRLDSEFLRANPQIASSFVIPILGGGGVALTNNNRTGTLNLVCTRVAAPDLDGTEDDTKAGDVGYIGKEESNGRAGMGVSKASPNYDTSYYDFVTLAQLQQAQEGGDSYGAQITIIFGFCGITTTVTFEGCTIAQVDPLGLAGNDAVNYSIAVNYLNWKMEYSKGSV